jgi:hypothetical protein
MPNPNDELGLRVHPTVVGVRALVPELETPVALASPELASFQLELVVQPETAVGVKVRLPAPNKKLPSCVGVMLASQVAVEVVPLFPAVAPVSDEDAPVSVYG